MHPPPLAALGASASAQPGRVPIFLPGVASVFAGPSIPDALPEAILSLVEQHLDGNLAQYVHSKKKDWRPAAKRQAYSKRQYIYSKVKEDVEATTSRFPANATFRDKMKREASKHDIKRGSATTVNQYYTILKKADPKTKKRKARGAGPHQALLQLARGAAGT